MSPDEFYRSLLTLIENAPEGIEESVLEHLTMATDELAGEMDTGISPGKQAAKDAMPEDMEDDDMELSDDSPGKQAAQEAAK